MFLPAHVAAGLIIGKLTGNYPLALAAAIVIDVDHIISYAKHGILFRPKDLMHTLTTRNDPWGDQRSILHNALVFVLISFATAIYDPTVGATIFFGYGSHLFLDALDDADYFPFFPSKKWNVRGPIGYFSETEMLFSAILFLVFLFV